MSNKFIIRLVASLMAVLVVGALIWPVRDANQAREDRQISEDLNVISDAVNSYFSDNIRMPSSLDELGLDEAISNRASQNGYEYTNDGFGSYVLCAVFATDTTSGTPYESPLTFDDSPDTSVHAAGRVCFEFDAPVLDSFGNDSFNLDSESLPFDQNDLEGLDQIEGLDDLLTPENLELFESLEL